MLLRDLLAGETKTELLVSEAHEINLYACLDIISFRHVPLIEDAY